MQEKYNYANTIREINGYQCYDLSAPSDCIPRTTKSARQINDGISNGFQPSLRSWHYVVARCLLVVNDGTRDLGIRLYMAAMKGNWGKAFKGAATSLDESVDLMGLTKV